MRLVLSWYRIADPSLALSVLAGCYCQLWYLTPEMALFALADRGLSQEEREEMAVRLHSFSCTVYSQGKPKFPVVNWSMSHSLPKLSMFVTSTSWMVFDRLGLHGPNNWLLRSCNEWPLVDEFRTFENFVKSIHVTNDIAERGCHLITEFCNRVNSDQARLDLIVSSSVLP